MSEKLIDYIISEKFIVLKFKPTLELLIPLDALRLSCPCAQCSGEKDVFGNIYKGETKDLSKEANTITHFSFVGRYGVKFVWGDGHSDGIYTFNLLKNLVNINEKK